MDLSWLVLFGISVIRRW